MKVSIIFLRFNINTDKHFHYNRFFRKLKHSSVTIINADLSEQFNFPAVKIYI